MKYFRHPTAILGPRAKIGEKTRIWAFVNIQGGAIIGKNCQICDSCFIEKNVVIGDNVTLKNGISVFEGIVIENDVFCGVDVAFINDRYPRSNRRAPWILEKTLIRKGATIGSNATILCGLTVGKYAFIGAGSVVTKDVAPFTIVAGNPARFVGYACRCGKRLNKSFECSCGLAYTLTRQGIKPNG